MILGSASRLDLDKNGSILLPQELLDFANIKTDVTLVGQGNYFEIWTPDLWKEQENSLNNVEANSHRFASLSISTG
jgi:MraZ protein